MNLQLDSSQFVNQVIESCESTNDLARTLGEGGHPHGTWVSARMQILGRGRLGRRWESEIGNLFLSMILRIEVRSIWTWVPLACAVGVTTSLDRLFPGVGLAIKWPNDLWILRDGEGAKLGGVLCEGIGSRNDAFIVMGLGLNCKSAPEGLDQETISLSCALAREISADDVRAEIITGVLEAIDSLQTFGSAQIARAYDRFAVFAPGTSIEWIPNGKSTQNGTVENLGPYGELCVRDAEGTTIKLYAEDVRVRWRKTV